MIIVDQPDRCGRWLAEKQQIEYCKDESAIYIGLENKNELKVVIMYCGYIKNGSIQRDIDLFKCSSGYFNEVVISSLDELIPVINRKFQTIGYLGFTKVELENWVKRSKPLGIDRIVPIGRTMDFSLTWDGYDLVYALSRSIKVN